MILRYRYWRMCGLGPASSLLAALLNRGVFPWAS